MKKTFKRTMAALLATATMAVGVGGISASATSWEAHMLMFQEHHK